MNEYEVELSVGDVLQVGDYTVTVMEIDGLEFRFRIDEPGEEVALSVPASGEGRVAAPR